jgi:hypothetical protein
VTSTSSERAAHPRRHRDGGEECRALLDGVWRLLVDRPAAYLNALRECWPALTASAALFVVNELRPWE